MELWMLIPAFAALLVGIWVGGMIGWEYGEEKIFKYFGGK
jgi:hypothetical protein